VVVVYFKVLPQQELKKTMTLPKESAHFEELGLGGDNWTHLTQNRVQWRTLAKMVDEPSVP
jgi:hypothetical protein